jgi:hypothetical protein
MLIARESRVLPEVVGESPDEGLRHLPTCQPVRCRYCVSRAVLCSNAVLALLTDHFETLRDHRVWTQTLKDSQDRLFKWSERVRPDQEADRPDGTTDEALERAPCQAPGCRMPSVEPSRAQGRMSADPRQPCQCPLAAVPPTKGLVGGRIIRLAALRLLPFSHPLW